MPTHSGTVNLKQVITTRSVSKKGSNMFDESNTGKKPSQMDFDQDKNGKQESVNNRKEKDKVS